MKLVYVSLMAALLTIGCKNKNATTSGTDSTFTITGTIKGLDSALTLGFQIAKDNATLDTIKIEKNGQFTLKGVTKEPLMASLFLLNNSNIAPLNFFVEPGNLEIESFKLEDLNKAKVSGMSNQDLKALQKVMLPFIQQLNSLKDSFKLAYAMGNPNAFADIQNKAQNISNGLRATVIEFSTKNPASVPAAFYVYQLTGDETNADVLSRAYNAFDDKVKNGLYGQKIKNSIDLLKKTGFNSPAPDFTLNNTDGKPVALSSFKGKYVLVDFWASWCSPCRQENPNVVAAFNKFKDKNFTIIGVSLDEDKAKWQKAIADDKLTWTHVSDLAGWQSKVAELYGVQSIPANFLLDKEGKVIGKNLRGAALEQKLAEVLK